MAGNCGAAYTDAEIHSLIEIIRQLKPISGQQWEIIAERHAEEWGDKNRTAESLKMKFRALVNMRAPTGDPNIPEVVFLAKQIDRRIVARSEASTGSYYSADDASNSGEDEQRPLGRVPELPPLLDDNVNPEAQEEVHQGGGGGGEEGGGVDLGQGVAQEGSTGGTGAVASAAAAAPGSAGSQRARSNDSAYDTPVTRRGTRNKCHKATEDEDSSNFTQMLQAMFASREAEREDRRAERELEKKERKEQKEQREQERRERQEQRELEREERHRQFDLQMQQLQQQAQFQNMLFMHMFGNNNSGGNKDNRDNNN